jgi:hypothetical protein
MKLPPGGGSRHPQAAGITLVAMMPFYENLLQGLKPLFFLPSFGGVETPPFRLRRSTFLQ